MDSGDIEKKYLELDSPSTEHSLAITLLYENIYLSKNIEGSIGIFFEINNNNIIDSTNLTKGLEITLSNTFEVTEKDNSFTKCSGYLVMLTDEDKIWLFYVLICEACRQSIESNVNFNEYKNVDLFISSWIEFFSSKKIGFNEVIGLWGELNILSHFSDINKGVDLWAGPLGSIFDFSSSALNIEVKTTFDNDLVWFNVEQLKSDVKTIIFIISLTRDNMSGVSLDDLVGEIKTKTKNSRDFDLMLAKTKYQPYEETSIKYRINKYYLFDAENIPRPSHDDKRIKTVRFNVEFQSLQELKSMDSTIVNLFSKNFHKFISGKI